MSPNARACVVPELAPCDPAELVPLVSRLEADEPITEPLVFPRGTLLPDGRLDLCKQALGPEGTRAVAAALRRSTRVSSILLGADGIGNAGAGAIAELMGENRTITTVFLGCNRIDASGAGKLAAALQDHPTLRALWIKRNPIGAEGAAAIARALPSARSLRTLDLAQTELDTGSGHEVAAAIRRCPSLRRLYLSGNRLTADDVPWIAEILRPGSPITALYLTANGLADEGARRLAAALEGNDTLEVLGLGSNGFGTDGLRALMEVLRRHPALQVLDLGRAPSTAVLGLDGNHLDDDGAAAIADLVRETRSLASLSLSLTGLSRRGVGALLDALEENRTLTQLNFRSRLEEDDRRRVKQILARNQAARATAPPDEDVRAIRSVYRTAAPGGKTRASDAMVQDALAPDGTTSRAREKKAMAQDATAPNAMASDPAAPEIAVSEGELASCAATLRALLARPERFFEKDPGRTRVRAEANRLIEAIRLACQDRKQQKRRGEGQRARVKQREHDRALVAATGIRAQRADPGAAPALASAAASATALEAAGRPDPAPGEKLGKPRSCYICKHPYRALHSFYDALCPSCAAYNEAKRQQTADLSGRVAVVTGGRIKIGYHVALKLLRAGARVIVTTRFPCDAALRYGREPDVDAWRDRLAIHGIDLRHLAAVEAFAGALSGERDGIDILINNAAQTVRRPPAFFEHLLEGELRGPAALPDRLGALVSPRSYHEGGAQLLGAGPDDERAPPHGLEVASLLSQVPLLPGDERRDLEAFPLDTLEQDGQQLDRRGRNSWEMSLDEVAPWELVEVHHVNVFAPFLLVRKLLPAMTAGAAPTRPRYIVNVSAMEGKFEYSRKRPSHPHTNMAKAALNMLTRTAGPELAGRGVLMTSVDTGWITYEQPFAIAEQMRQSGSAPPLDTIDGAARILDPVFQGVNAGVAMHSVFLKDYHPTDW